MILWLASFDWEDFLAPLDMSVIVMSLILGVSLGVSLSLMSHRMSGTAVFWQFAGGAIFFLPLSVLRGLQGSNVWERFLATYVLWAIFVFGMWMGKILTERAKK